MSSEFIDPASLHLPENSTSSMVSLDFSRYPSVFMSDTIVSLSAAEKAVVTLRPIGVAPDFASRVLWAI